MKMNIVPQNPSEFATGGYWREFFDNVNYPFEWYGLITEYAFRVFLPFNANSILLQVGCGNSKLEIDMYSAGFRNIHSIDINAQVIAQKISTAMAGLTYEVADITAYKCEDGVYDGIIDKGTLDALYPTPEPEFLPTVNAMFATCLRVLKNGGKYFIITLGQEHILQALEFVFQERRDLSVLVHRVDIPDESHTYGVLPSVLIEITKLSKPFPEGIPLSLYYADHSFADKPVRVPTSVISKELLRRRHMYMFFSKCKKHVEEPMFIDLLDRNDVKRWRFWVLDGPTSSIYTLAFMVVSPESQVCPEFYDTDLTIFENFRRRVGCDRVVFAEQQKEISYGTHEAISDELEELACHFMTKDCSPNATVLYVSPDSGDKFILFTGESELAGPFEVQNAFLDSLTTIRRLIFTNTPHVVQTDCVVRKVHPTDLNYTIVDTLNLNSAYQAAMVAAICFRYGSIESFASMPLKVAIIGVGGGTLPTFLHQVFKEFRLTCVELVSEFFEVAAEYFDFPYKDKRVDCVAADGLDWLDDSTVPKHDVLFIDVGVDSDGDYISYPPEPFNTIQVIQKYKERVHDRGLVIANIYIDNAEKYHTLVSKFQAVFEFTALGEFGGNRVLVASNSTFAPRKQYTSRIVGAMENHLQIVATKLCDFFPVKVPKRYRVPKVGVIEKQEKKKEKAIERQKKSVSREKELQRKNALKRQSSADSANDEVAAITDDVANNLKISEPVTVATPKISYAAMVVKKL